MKISIMLLGSSQLIWLLLVSMISIILCVTAQCLHILYVNLLVYGEGCGQECGHCGLKH